MVSGPGSIYFSVKYVSVTNIMRYGARGHLFGLYLSVTAVTFPHLPCHCIEIESDLLSAPCHGQPHGPASGARTHVPLGWSWLGIPVDPQTVAWRGVLEPLTSFTVGMAAGARW